MSKSRSRWIGLLACTAIALYLCWQILQPFVEVALWAGVLAVVAYPVHRWFMLRVNRRNVAALLTCLFVVLAVVLPLGFIGLLVVKQAYPAVQSVQKLLPELAQPTTQPATQSATAPATQPKSALHRFSIIRSIDRHLDIDSLLNPEFINERLKTLGTYVGQKSLQFLGGLLESALKIGLTLFALFYILSDAPRILQAIHDWMPVDSRQADKIMKRAEEVISASVFGVLIIAAIQGALGGIIFAILGVPSPALWGSVMFLLSMIPFAGSALVWAPAAIVLMFTGHPYKAVILIAFGAGVIGTIDNVLRPYLVGNKARLHELVIFFSVLGGIQVFGVLGLFIGPVVVALTSTLLDVYQAQEEPGPGESAAAVAPVESPPEVVDLPPVDSVPPEGGPTRQP